MVKRVADFGLGKCHNSGLEKEKHMANPTTNYGFVLPTSSDLVTDLPADFDVALQGVDTRLKALQPGTTLGDLAYSSATANTNTRLAIGSTGQVLTVAGGVPTWSAAGGGQNWTLLNAGGTSLTSATTVTISGISTKNQIAVLINQASTVNAQSEISVRINTDTGSNYYPYGFQNINTSTYNAANMGFSVSGASSSILLGKTQEVSANGTLTGACFISGANSSGVKFFQSLGSGYSVTSNSGHATAWTMGVYDSASTVSSVSVFSNSGNFDAGTVFVYTTA
jgi:hypothetical protein